MLQKTSDWLYLYSIPLLIIVLYTTEAFFKIYEFFLGETTVVLKAVKLIVLLGVAFFIIKNKPKVLFWPFILVLSFSIGQTQLKNPFLAEIIIEFGKYMYVILLLIFFNIYTLSKTQRDKLFLFFEMILVFNSLLVLLGYCFDIMVFKTYDGNRFGYNGLLVTSATGSYFYIIGLIYILLKHKTQLFKKPLNYLIFGAALIVGTKSLYIFLIGFVCVFILWFMKRKIKIILFSIIGLLTISLFYYFFFINSIFNKIRQSDGLLSAVMSYRDQLLVEKTLPFIKLNWHFTNYFFGGISDITTKSQIDIVDVFYCFGTIGGILYLYVFLKAFLTFKINQSMIFLLSLMLLIVLFAGNFFSYASVAIYVVILRETIINYEYSKLY